MKLVVMVASVLAIITLHAMRPAGLTDWSDPKSLAAFMGTGSSMGIGGFALFSTILIFAGVPRLLFFAAGGLLMGFGAGFPLALTASVTGSYASFLLLRWGGRDWLAKRRDNGKFLGKITGSEPTVASVFFIRQLPVSNLLINAGLAMGRVKTPAFLMGSLLGFIPQGAVATLIGSGMAEERLPQGAAQLGIAAAIMAGTWFFWSARAGNHTAMEEGKAR
ncbi:MAG: VTT domain-containing protein [Akkermansiaceae bacterium]|nr:VTT domain-containing protein [Akkermansiaceae bacterium]